MASQVCGGHWGLVCAKAGGRNMCGVFLGKGEYSQVDAEEATDFLHPLPKGVLGSSRKKDSYWS